jgi:hypothetical protein
LSSSGQENILNKYGKIRFDVTVDWYVLKATALFIQSNIEQNMCHHLQQIDKDDPIAILVKLNDICAGINPGIIRQTMTKLNQQRIGSTESATLFIAWMHILFDDAFALKVELEETEKINIVLAGKFGNDRYASQVNHFCLIRKKEELTPNRYVEDNLQLADIERTLNNFDLQYQLHCGGTPNKNTSTGKRYGPTRFSGNKPNHSAHQVHVAPNSTGTNSVMRCFICSSTDHKVGQCPGKS